jgi:hypothetical protein
MLDDLRAWERARPAGAPRLLVLSTGTPEANGAMDLRSTILHDDGARVARAFGAQGTPMAVMVDSVGDIASPLAAGAEAVLKLAVGEEASSSMQAGAR